MKKVATMIVISLTGFAILAFLFFSIRQVFANRQIEAERGIALTAAPPLAVTSRLEIIPLYEAASSTGDLISGHGVSYLIRTDSASILFDVGDNPDQSPVAPFMQNMGALGIDWAEIDRIVISHPHPDHVGGTKAWWSHSVSIGDLRLPDDLGDRLIFVPTPMNFHGAVHATIPTLPAPDVATTGVISYREAFPMSLFEPKGSEQALVVNIAGYGLALITGCGHPGLEKLVERAERIYGGTVVVVVGGLHYMNATAQEVESHIQFLQSREPVLVALSAHDSSPQALSAFQSAFRDRYHTLRVGDTVHFP